MLSCVLKIVKGGERKEREKRQIKRDLIKY